MRKPGIRNIALVREKGGHSLKCGRALNEILEQRVEIVVG